MALMRAECGSVPEGFVGDFVHKTPQKELAATARTAATPQGRFSTFGEEDKVGAT